MLPLPPRQLPLPDALATEALTDVEMKVLLRGEDPRVPLLPCIERNPLERPVPEVWPESFRRCRVHTGQKLGALCVVWKGAASYPRYLRVIMIVALELRPTN